MFEAKHFAYLPLFARLIVIFLSGGFAVIATGLAAYSWVYHPDHKWVETGI